MGGLAETHAPVHRPRSLAALRALFAGAEGRSFSLVGARHSFGAQIFPVAGGEAIDLTELGGSVTLLEGEGPEQRWVRASGSMTFEALAAAVPGFLTRRPPTSDLITLAGALVGCTHDSVGFFADHVRRFTVLTPDGRLHECHAAAEGIAGELFALVPGSFGTLGVVVELELRLYAAPASRCIDIAVHRGMYVDDPACARLATLAAQPETQGAGLFLYGVRGPTVLFEGRVAEKAGLAPAPPLPLTDDATTRNVYLQALASLAPRLAGWISSRILVDGRRFRAPVYGHAFFQRSYGRAHRILAGPSLGARALRLLGLDPRLPVVHQTFVIPAPAITAFLAIYFDELERHPALVRRLEQQDLIRLPECGWPMHAAFGMRGGAFFLTTSIGVERGGASEHQASAFMGRIAALTHEPLGVKTLLLKQTHGDAEQLRTMHAAVTARLHAAKAEVDPRGVLRSRFFDQLTDA